ncbi:unnamed protein product [Spirodela intermedia]|uniref:Transcription elongation factor Eaf N-terminal domain-containing protein n=2 Tax=Spirodela intermedia TaxID=51605 RepID=A0A7I8JNP3_SPIIN|nr:unnamed protein product [Spirodela intermedia]CAA6671395.1 unnamed protein product [Spirodela intermedia]CAA7408490.1 unnamed protein product [Spirodela intermedia]
MASHGGGGEPSTAPQPDRWYTLRLGSSFKEDRPASKFCTLRYEFQPASIDKSQSGSLHKSKESRITVEFQNNQPGKPKVTFEGTSEEYKENDGVLFFDGETLRLERLHRAVKRLRHVRKPGESSAASCASAAVNSTVPPAVGAESRSPPVSKTSKSQPLSKSMAHSVPLEVERIDIGESDGPVCKASGKAAEEKKTISAPPNPPPQASPDRKSADLEETVDIEMDDDDAIAGGEAAAALGLAGELPERSDSDDEIADVDVSDDDRGRGPNAAEALRAQVNAGEDEPATSSSSESSGSGSGSSDSDSDGSDDNSSSSGGDVDIDIDGEDT